MKKQKEKPLKCYYLMISRYFGKGHPSAGQSTYFVEKIHKALGTYSLVENLNFEVMNDCEPKIHTVRLNYALWKKRFEEIAAGKAYLSLRYWLDEPYKSPQEEFARLTANDGIGLQKLSFPLGIFIDDYDAEICIENIANNDGLTLDDFGGWFGEIQHGKEYAILQFTAMRYPNSFTKMEYSKLHFTYEKD